MFPIAPQKPPQPDPSQDPTQGPAQDPSQGEPPVPPELLALLQGQDQSMSDPSMMDGEDQGDGRKVDQSIVLYMTGDQGPFRCDHCVNWQGNGKCAIVNGQIDPAGCCNLFEPGGGEPDEDETGGPSDQDQDDVNPVDQGDQSDESNS